MATARVDARNVARSVLVSQRIWTKASFASYLVTNSICKLFVDVSEFLLGLLEVTKLAKQIDTIQNSVWGNKACSRSTAIREHKFPVKGGIT